MPFLNSTRLRSPFLSLAIILSAICSAALAQQERFDIVLANGRVMDPETGLDATRSVGIRGDKIVAISQEPMPGKAVVDVSGLVVAPGFIDLHAHGQSNQANEYQARDGVTTALELESGVPFVDARLRMREGKALLNYGFTVSHGRLRPAVIPELADGLADVRALNARGEPARAKMRTVFRDSRHRELASEQLDSLVWELKTGLDEGALGIGVTHGYYPGATREEIFRVFEAAAKWKVPIFTHVRGLGADHVQEVIANAAVTGAPLHIVHANSVSLWELPLTLKMVAAARNRGLDITTETYPYTAASSGIRSTIFDPGWRERLRISYEDIQLQDTSERLTPQTFDKYRTEGGVVIFHMMKEEWIELAVGTPFVVIASDGMPYAPGAHPRGAGTFSRVLGRYVREKGVLTLMEALEKMTLLPARRLENIAPQMKNKGRLKVGADADVTVFNPDEIIDTATFEDDLSFSKGVRHVLVNGVFVVRDGKTVDGALPGRPVLGRYKTAGGAG